MIKMIMITTNNKNNYDNKCNCINNDQGFLWIKTNMFVSKVNKFQSNINLLFLA
jgi:hypothetical protein